jgi:lysophospholipase L1-like esterase
VNDETLSIEQYGDYLSRVRSAYPTSKVVALSPFSGKHVATIEAAVKAADDEAIWFVDTEGWITPDDCTDGLHPSTEGHAKIAAHLIERLDVLTNLTRL